MNTTASDRPAGYEPMDAPPELAEVADVIAAQRARLAGATDMGGRLVFGIWGVAWFLGYGAIWAAADASGPDLVPDPVAWSVFIGLLVAALVVTAVHVARRSAGVRGASARQGAMYGFSWLAACAAFIALEVALGRAEVSAEVASLVGATLPPLIVGLLYMAGGGGLLAAAAVADALARRAAWPAGGLRVAPHRGDR